MAKKAAKKVAAKKVARTRVTDDDLIGDAPKKPATKQAKPRSAPPLAVVDAEAPPADTGIPPYPPELATIEAGRKSPAVMKWYRDNHPEAYKKLYGHTVG